MPAHEGTPAMNLLRNLKQRREEDYQGAQWRAQAFVSRWDADATEWAQKCLGRPEVFAADFDALRVRPFEEIVGPTPGNLVVAGGWSRIGVRMLSNTAPPWTVSSGGSGSSGIGVGNSSQAAAKSDTTLVASGVNKFHRVCDDAFPTAGLNGSNDLALVFKTTYQNAEANFDWAEYGIYVPSNGAGAFPAASSSAPLLYTLLNRKATSLGVKSSGTASLQITITISS